MAKVCENGTVLVSDSRIYSEEVFFIRNNVTLNCNNSLINGTGQGKGIYLLNKTDNDIINCNISNFEYGIYLDESSNNAFTDNTVEYNQKDGLYLRSNSKNNTINNNKFCFNSQADAGYYDIRDEDNNKGDNNTCDLTNNWNDTGTTGCTYACECICLNCHHCVYKLNDNSCTQVNLTADIQINGSTCIDNPENFENKTFDCQGHYIKGDDTGGTKGIYLRNKDNNTIKNCNISGFANGIRLFEFSNNNNLINNTANDNTEGITLDTVCNNNTLTSNTANDNTEGITLEDSSNNTLTSNTANNNADYGIMFDSSSNNTLTSNTANDNTRFGIVLTSSSNNNTLTDTTIKNNTDWGDIYIYDSTDNIFSNATIGLKYPTSISFDKYSGSFGIKGVENPSISSLKNIGKYVNITNSSAAWIYLNISYSDSDLPASIIESSIRTHHYDGTAWTVVSESGVNTTNNIVYANLTDFSVFAPLGNYTPDQPGGGGGSGGTPRTGCTQSWKCTEWSECLAAGIKVRTCHDANDCRKKVSNGTFDYVITREKPAEEQSCIYTAPEKPEEEKPPAGEKPEEPPVEERPEKLTVFGHLKTFTANTFTKLKTFAVQSTRGLILIIVIIVIVIIVMLNYRYNLLGKIGAIKTRTRERKQQLLQQRTEHYRKILESFIEQLKQNMESRDLAEMSYNKIKEIYAKAPKSIKKEYYEQIVELHNKLTAAF